MHWLARRLAASRTDRGVTLVETLVALSILSVAGVAIMTGLQLSIRASDIHRSSANNGANVRNYAEAIERYIEDVEYLSCAGVDAYSPAKVGFALPEEDAGDYTITQAAAERIDNAQLAAGSAPWQPCPSVGADDGGLQRLKLTLERRDGVGTETVYLVVRRPCSGASLC